MKIGTLTIENFKSIERLQIDFGGDNAIISGQNGTGKTTVVDAVTWLLANRMSDGKTGEAQKYQLSQPRKQYEQITNVEIIFDNGLKLRRECNGSSVFYVNDVPCNATEFKVKTARLFNNAIPALLLPFNFCRLHYTERRNILMHLFASHIQFDMTGFAEIAADLQTLTPSEIIKRENQNLKKIGKELITIPARISELQESFATYDLPAINAEINDVKRKLAAQDEIIKQCQAAFAGEKELRAIQNKLADLRAEYRSNEIELNRLRREYSELAQAQTGTCPTCGNTIPAEHLEDIQAKLAAVAEQGAALAQRQQLIKTQGEELQATKPQAVTADAADNLHAAFKKRDALQDRLGALKIQLADATEKSKIQARIEKLKARELELGNAKNLCDKKIFLAENYIRRKIELTEKAINEHFQFVSFQMFEQYKTSDGIRETCEPLLNGVPYAALSKGEQLKASLDILQALQAAFKIELPVFIDDAESYTSNSFVDLPNQIILLKATEGVAKLQIEVAAKNFERKTA